MKNSKIIFKILVILVLVIQNSFAASKPVPGIGIVVKKNNCLPKACKSTCNHGGGVAIVTNRNGCFSSQLEEGEYELSFSQDQLKTVINGFIKRDYPKNNYQYDGSGVELALDNSSIRVKLKPIRENIYSITEQNSTLVIVVPEGGAMFSGVLSWNDAFLTNSVTDNRGIDKADIRKTSNPYFNNDGMSGDMVSMNKTLDESVSSNSIGSLHITKDEKRLKGIGLKKNEIENSTVDADVKSIAETLVNRKSVNNINGGMPNRISMNVTVPKQTQGATFGEKVGSGKLNITLIEGGCVVLFPLNDGYRINTADKSITDLTSSEGKTFGEKVNAGLHAAGGALAQGASLPGGSIVSAAVSSVGNLAGGAGGGTAAASYARAGKLTKADAGKSIQKIKDDETNAILELEDGEFELVFVVVEKATSGLKDTLKTQVRIGFMVENGVLKTKHDTAKNSVSNIR